MVRLLTALVGGLCFAACSSSSTAPSPPLPVSSATPTSIPGQSIAVDPSSLQFGNQMVGTTSSTRSVTLTNTGNMPQPVGDRMNGFQWRGFASTNDCPPMLAVGASCSATVSFTPTAPGPWSAFLVIDGTEDEEGIVNVFGTGIS